MFKKKEIEKLDKFLFQQSLSVIRHDLNNYLTVTLNYSNFIKDDKIKEKLKNSIKKTISYLKEDAEKKYNLEEKYTEPIDAKILISSLKDKFEGADLSLKFNEDYTDGKINIRYRYFHLIIIRFLIDYIINCENITVEVSDNKDFLIINFKFDSCIDKDTTEDFTLDIIKRFFDKKSILVKNNKSDSITLEIPYLKQNIGG